MTPAVWPRDDRTEERLLRVDRATGELTDARVRDLVGMLRPGDLLVVNDAATLPASLAGIACVGAGPKVHEEPVEVRLFGQPRGAVWSAVLFGAGDWRIRTEDRPAPPRLGIGDTVRFGPALTAEIRAVSPRSPRLVELAMDRSEASMWSAIYALGRPVQYAYVKAPLALWHLQTTYASRPWAAEMPSAGRPLTFGLLLEMRRHGVSIASLTHAAGLSSTGDHDLDALLPFAESYEIPASTAEAVHSAKERGGRVIAIGTSVVRALESASLPGGRVASGSSETRLVIGPGFVPAVVQGLLTGVHERGATHFALLGAFAPSALLERAQERALRRGYQCHEFGDSMLLL